MHNKAVVNEETTNDVNLLREQIRQLKVHLVFGVEVFLISNEHVSLMI